MKLNELPSGRLHEYEGGLKKAKDIALVVVGHLGVVRDAVLHRRDSLCFDAESMESLAVVVDAVLEKLAELTAEIDKLDATMIRECIRQGKAVAAVSRGQDAKPKPTAASNRKDG